MHKEALLAMGGMLTKVGRAPRGGKALDVGAYDVNGNYRALVEYQGWRYTGLDVAPGPNVDVVSEDPYHFPFGDGQFDLVLSGSTMEHVQAIWRWIPELARVLKPGGSLAIVTHWQFMEHRYPVDCWRIMADGMRYLFDETGVLENYDLHYASQWDIAAYATKKVVR